MNSAEELCPEKQQLLEAMNLSVRTVADRVNGRQKICMVSFRKNSSKDLVAYSTKIGQSTQVRHISNLEVLNVN
jgi:hypothetical protein